jgi:hypothetical protein
MPSRNRDLSLAFSPSTTSLSFPLLGLAARRAHFLILAPVFGTFEQILAQKHHPLSKKKCNRT